MQIIFARTAAKTVNGLVVETASVAFENEMTLPKHRKPVWLVVHNCVGVGIYSIACLRQK